MFGEYLEKVKNFVAENRRTVLMFGLGALVGGFVGAIPAIIISVATLVAYVVL